MPPDAIAADNGPLTIEQAVEHLDKLEEQAAAPEKPEKPSKEEPNTEAEPAAEDASEPEAVTDGETAETDDAVAEGEEPELPAIEPPRFWDAEAKKRFGELPRDLQELVLAKETERDKASSLKFEEAASVRKAAEAEASKLLAITSKLDKLIPEAEQTFAAKWGIGEIDWNRVAQEQGVERAFQLKNDYDREQAAIQGLKTTQAEADAIQNAKFVQTRNQELFSIVPDLADDKPEGQKLQLELVNYLAKEGGITPDTIIKRASSKELVIGYKAYLYDKLNADAKAKASSKPTSKPAVPARPSVKPTAAPARAGSPQSARLQQLNKKPHLTMDEAVERMGLMEELNP